MRTMAKLVLAGALLIAASMATAQEVQTTQQVPATGRDPLIDRVHRGVYDTVWRSAMRLDHLFGSQYDEKSYRRVTGSISPIFLWDEFEGFRPRLRFNVDLPLPQLNERFNAFIGRVNRDEYVTERAPQAAAFGREFGSTRDEQTIFGISYRAPPKQGSRFDGGVGVRLQFPLDPYVKGSYIFQHGAVEDKLFSFRQTLFYQASERLGTTSRVDLERLFAGPWLVRWTSSGTISQESEGVRGYSSIMALRGFSGRKSVAVAVGFNGETEAPVTLQDYGIKVAYRKGIARDWLVLELRTSLDWPKEELDQPRKPSWGVGIGFEMSFGTNEFLARPVTF